MANGWTPERRARQAELIHAWKPWERSTGAKTPAGKVRAAANSFKHGMRTAEMIATGKKIKSLLAWSRELVAESIQ